MNKFSAIIFTIFVLLCGYYCELGLCRQDNKFIRMKLGGVHDCKGSQNSGEIESLARFAVQEHNKKENVLLEFVRVLKAKEQMVAGKLYHLTLEAVDAGNKNIYEVKVWVKPWMNFKQLQEFKHVEGGTGPSFTASDLGVKLDDHGPGWQVLPTNDPEVQDAANHAVNSIRQRPLKTVKFDLLLTARKGHKEENYRVDVIKNMEGKFYFN